MEYFAQQIINDVIASSFVLGAPQPRSPVACQARSAFEPDSESFARGASAPATRSLSAPTAGTTCQCRLSESSVVVWLNLNGEPGVSPASG